MTSPSFTHLRRLTDAGGLYEHALLDVPRQEHGYCVDDVARGLVVVCRDPVAALANADLRALYLAFVLEAQVPDGRFRNRRASDGSWTSPASAEDCWGRALWGLGAVVAGQADPEECAAALEAFERGAGRWAPWPRAMAFATLGAAAVHSVLPDHRLARELLAVGGQSMNRPAPLDDWPWPEPRLSYANAAIPEALLASGSALHDDRMINDGLLLLGWLVKTQTRSRHLSVVPVGGRAPGQQIPVFDQQPIEVAALADAAARALLITGDEQWRRVITMAAAWFEGDNDARTPMYEHRTGGGTTASRPRGGTRTGERSRRSRCCRPCSTPPGSRSHDHPRPSVEHGGHGGPEPRARSPVRAWPRALHRRRVPCDRRARQHPVAAGGGGVHHARGRARPVRRPPPRPAAAAEAQL